MLNTTNYITGLFNQSALLYANDNIPVELSSLYIWDVPSPYTSNNTQTQLNLFKATTNSFTGDLGNLLGYAGGGGVAASLYGLCAANIDYSQSYSGISAAFQNVPLFSWSVAVVTHEQGHLLGSRHTHACVWNGNNTAIDGCGPMAGYPYEGTCSGAPIPSGGGTIMSYCHLISAGINFSLGFGSQPSTVILNNYTNSSCLSACVGGTFCGSPTGLTTTGITTSTVTFDWVAPAGATGYYVHYRESGTTTWLLDSTNTNAYTAIGLLPGTNYEWQVQTICSNNNSVWSSIVHSITVPLVCNAPSLLTFINISSITARVSWTATQAATAYVVEYKESAMSAWTSDTTSDTTYRIAGLMPLTAYDCRVYTICVGGGTSAGSPTGNFTTLDIGAPVTVVLQPDSLCGKDAVIGSLGAYQLNNFGDHLEFDAIAWTNGGQPGVARSLLEFDLSFIPAGSSVTNASLSLYYFPNNVNSGHSQLTGSNSATLRKITSPWGEMTVTWNNQPGTTTAGQIIVPASTSNSQDYLNMDVTAMMQDFVDDPAKNYGFMFILDNETPFRSLTFGSSDNPDATIRPKLEITYLPNITECATFQYSTCDGVDAEVASTTAPGYDTTNWGYHPEFNAISGTYSGVHSIARSMIYWDLSSIPVNASVTQATLDLFWDPFSGNVGHSTLSGSNEARLYRIISPWDEMTVDWHSQPSIDTSQYAILPASTSTQQDYSIDVTNLIQGFISNPISNYGLELRLANETAYRSLIFCSSDHADPAKHPKLSICYELPTGIINPAADETAGVYQDNTLQSAVFYSPVEFGDGTSVFLYSIDGKLVHVVDVSRRKSITINKQNLSTGLYMYRIMGKNVSRSGRIVFR